MRYAVAIRIGPEPCIGTREGCHLDYLRARITHSMILRRHASNATILTDRPLPSTASCLQGQ
jgi:hypothetical protein